MSYSGHYSGHKSGHASGHSLGVALSKVERMEAFLGHTLTNLWVSGKLECLKTGLTLTESATSGLASLGGTIDGGGIVDGQRGFADNNAQVVVPNTTDLQANGSEDRIWIILLKLTGGTAGDLMGTRTATSGNVGFEIRRPNTTSFGHTWDDGGTAVFGSPLSSASTGVWHFIAAEAYETGQDYHIADSDGAGANETEFNKVLGDMTSDRGFSVGKGRLTCARFDWAMLLHLTGSEASNYATGGDLKNLLLGLHDWIIDGNDP